MKRILLFVCIQFFLLASFAGETINFCKSWKFHLGDAGKGASSSSYNDSQWRILNIPHDWSIEGTYKQFENGTDWQSGFLPAGISWYRKTFTIPSKWKNKKVQILFEGVYLNSEVWINGHWLGKRPNGYISFDQEYIVLYTCWSVTPPTFLIPESISDPSYKISNLPPTPYL